MLTKKKLLERIEALEKRVLYLENMHARVHPMKSWEICYDLKNGPEWKDINGDLALYGTRQLKGAEISTAKSHPLPRAVPYRLITDAPKSCANTQTIGKVSFEEVAQLVIDKKPIERTGTYKGKMGIKYDRASVVESVETPIGIVVRENINRV